MVARFAERRGERSLDLRSLVEELKVAGLLSETDFQRMTDVNAGSMHPLVYLAEQKFTRPDGDQLLDMESLLDWLAKESSQGVYQIDPLKINVGAIA